MSTVVTHKVEAIIKGDYENLIVEIAKHHLTRDEAKDLAKRLGKCVDDFYNEANEKREKEDEKDAREKVLDRVIDILNSDTKKSNEILDNMIDDETIPEGVRKIAKEVKEGLDK